MNVYNNWKKMQIHILIVTIIAVVSGGAAMIFPNRAEELFYSFYLVNSITATISCIVFAVKHGFKWWYIGSVVFVDTIFMIMFFNETNNAMVPAMFVSFLSIAVVSTAIGTIIGKIRKNNDD